MLFFVKSNLLDEEVVWNVGVATMVLLSLIFVVNVLYLIITTLISLRH